MRPFERQALRIRAFKSGKRILELGRAESIRLHAPAGWWPDGLPPIPVDRWIIQDGLAEAREVSWRRYEKTAIANAGKAVVFMREVRTCLTVKGKIAYLKICAEVNQRSADNDPSR